MPNDRTKRWRRLAVLWAMSASIVATLVSFPAEVPLLIYNASGSAPLGFYYLEQRMPLRGELAVYKPPPAAHSGSAASPERPESSRDHASSLPQPSGDTSPSPVTTMRRMIR
jgi:hypothetical protein